MDKPVRVRIAPSPTGEPHVGHAYMGLFNMVFAKVSDGKFVLRIEDTDRTRYSEGSESAILESLRWLGIEWDEGPDVGGPCGPYRQSERTDRYQKHAEQLVADGAAYYCFCTPERLKSLRETRKGQDRSYDGHCRELVADEVERRLAEGESHVIRLKVPAEGETVFKDYLRKEVRFQNSAIDDQVLLKSDGFPTYHLANVVDDRLMEISHVIRAEEWISSTPKHILLYQAFGWEPPVFIHMPILRNADKSKISKRKNATSLEYYRSEGFLPPAMLNFLALLGGGPPGEEEVFTLQEMMDSFSWDNVNTTGPVFDLAKLEWLNGVYIRQLSADELWEALQPFIPEEWQSEEAKLRQILPLVRERMKRLSEFREKAELFFEDRPSHDPQTLIPKKREAPETAEMLEKALGKLAEWPEWATPETETEMRAFCEELGWKVRDVFMSLRGAVTGRTVSPPLFETMEVLGREESLQRIREAIELLRG